MGMAAEPASETDSREPSGAIAGAASWLEVHGDALFRFARARVANRETAEDLVQETLLAALQSHDRFELRSSVSTWLFSILRHKISDHYRREGAVGGPSGATAGAEVEAGSESRAIVKRFFTNEGFWRNAPSRWKRPDEALQDDEFWRVLDGCLSGLPRTLSESFVLRELDQLDQEELCKVLDLTPGNLRVRLHRARLLLRDCLTTKWFGSRSERAPRKP